MAKNNLVETSLYFNLSYSYFAQMRLNNIEKFNDIFGNDENQIKSAIMYAERIEKLIKKVEVILNKLNPHELMDFMFDNKILNYKQVPMTYEREHRAIFQIREDESDFISINYKLVTKWRKMVAAFVNVEVA